MGRIFKIVGLRWVPTGKIFTSSMTKVDSEPSNGSNEDITNQYECEQTLDVSAGTLNLSAAMTSDHNSSELEIHDHNNEPSSSKLVPKVVPPADKTATSQQELELIFSPMYEEYFNAGNQTVMSSSTVTYTLVYSNSEPWRFQWVFDDELEAPKEVPQPPGQAPPSPDYVPRPEHPPLPEYVASPEYPEYLVPSEDEAPIKDQPLPADASPTALSLGYVADSDPSEEDPKEDPEEDPADYPTDGGDDDDDDEEEEKEASEEDVDEEEEEHLASSNSTTLPAIDHVPLAKRADVLPRKRLCLTALAPRFKVRESSAAAAARQPGLDVVHATDYSFVDTVDAIPGRPISREVGYKITDVWNDMVGDMEGRAPTTFEELRQRVTDLAATLARDTHEMYVRFEDA
ncbi:hypothetical protein Tco_1111665 [Tanacetum coccineum]|uniref:Uncharacterized protein n=1 Tax=Tanacetum coccineum TaxID=301880 RepID=A0ABQ5IMD9_9ASTR